jgi:hypothetical protein
MIVLKHKKTDITVRRYDIKHDVFGSIVVDDYCDSEGHMGIEIWDKMGNNIDDTALVDEICKFLNEQD